MPGTGNALEWMAGAKKVLIVLSVLAVVAAVALLVATERVIKLRRRAHQRRQMAYRLTAAAARAEVAERNRKAAVAASGELTSMIPAINHPLPTFESIVRQDHRPGQDHRPRQGRQHNTGPQRLTGPQRAGTGPQRRAQRRVGRPEGGSGS